MVEDASTGYITVGALGDETNSPTLDRLWSDRTYYNVYFAGEMKLNPAEPHALVFKVTQLGGDAGVEIVSAVSGQVLWASYNDAEISPGYVIIDNIVIDDLDLDTYDELVIDVIYDQPGAGPVTYVVGERIGNPPSAVDGPGAARLARLQQNVPNPLNGSTSISFELPEAGPVRLRVYDTAGRLVRTLVNDSRAAGSHTVAWDGRDDRGRDTASGIYFYELDVAGSRLTRKLIQVR